MGPFRQCLLAAGLLAMLTMTAPAQLDTVTVPGDHPPDEGNLNDAIQDVIKAGKLSYTVFSLEPGGQYVLTEGITTPPGERLTIVALEPGNTQATAPPQIRWTSDDTVNTWFIVRSYGDITLKNVWLMYARTNGWQSYSSIQIEDNPDSINGQHAEFDGVIFDYAALGGYGSGAVSVASKRFRGRFTNCYFRNCVDMHYRYYGRAVSFPFNSTGWHIDSLHFDNCTFANMGYVYMQEGGEYGDFVWFNHCTFINVVMFTLESGWWHWLNVSNSAFVNTYMLGDSPYERWSTSPYPFGGTINIDSISAFGFDVPFTETRRHILFTHSSYAVEPWLRDYMASGYDGRFDTSWFPRDRWPVPQPMMSEKTRAFFNDKTFWPHVSMGSLHDSTDPGFLLAPTNVSGIKSFLYFKWTGSQDTNWAYDPEDGLNGVWPMKEDLSYTNPDLLAAGMGGFPLGDLYHWFPERYGEWKVQEAAEYGRIATWLTDGRDPSGIGDEPGAPPPVHFELSQNYPNPFNPLTEIRYTIGVARGSGWGASRTTLVVYDVLGREVERLLDEMLTPGTYSVIWDASARASGVYFYRLTSGGFQETKRLVLTK